MDIRVLGCYGAQLPGYNTTGFLLNGNILIDAGTVTSVLSMEEQINIEYILVTHSHLDHVKDIVFLADNVHLRKRTPVTIVTTPGIIDILKGNIFNNYIWPDFSLIPNSENPVIQYHPIEEGDTYSMERVTVRVVKVNHTVETVAFIIECEGKTVLFVGDTGPTNDVWTLADGLDNLKAVFVETSFPDAMQDIADVAGHFTPSSFCRDIEKLAHQSPDIYLYHLKPQYAEVIETEIESLGKNNVRILREGETISI
jgi:ribonuclease BN (tRNA processing enzyme)